MTALLALLALAAVPDTLELELPADRMLPMEIGKQYVVRLPGLRLVPAQKTAVDPPAPWTKQRPQEEKATW